MKKIRLSTSCPCNPQVAYESCCGPYLTATAIPSTAEQLMRSRYTAYTQGNIDYIIQTQQLAPGAHFDPLSAQLWAKQVKWRRLKVIRSFAAKQQDHVYFVEFLAYFIEQGKPNTLHEISEFHHCEGKWYYWHC